MRRAGDGGCRAAVTRKKPPQSPSTTAPGRLRREQEIRSEASRRLVGSRGHQASHRPLSRLRRQLPARRGAAEIEPHAVSQTFAVPRLAGDRSAKRIRGSVSDSVTLESTDIHARLSAIESRPPPLPLRPSPLDRRRRVVPREDRGSIRARPGHRFGAVLAEPHPVSEAGTRHTQFRRGHLERHVRTSEWSAAAGQIQNPLNFDGGEFDRCLRRWRGQSDPLRTSGGLHRNQIESQWPCCGRHRPVTTAARPLPNGFHNVLRRDRQSPRSM